jgi:hypothetical protein
MKHSCFSFSWETLRLTMSLRGACLVLQSELIARVLEIANKMEASYIELMPDKDTVVRKLLGVSNRGYHFSVCLSITGSFKSIVGIHPLFSLISHLLFVI